MTFGLLYSSLAVGGASILGGVWRRWFGGWLGGRRSIQLLVALVLGALIGVALQPLSWLTAGNALLISALIAALWTPGHGSYMDMGTIPRPDNETARYIVKPLARVLGLKADSEAYDVLGMSIRYGLLTLAVGLWMAFTGLSGWWVFALAGFLAGPIYAASKRVATHFTEVGEVGIGATIYGLLALAYVV